jgi:hypothetical protein
MTVKGECCEGGISGRGRGKRFEIPYMYMFKDRVMKLTKH